MGLEPHDKRHKVVLEAFYGLWAEVGTEGEVTRQGSRWMWS